MEPFLDRLAALILARHGTRLERVLVVLPGRRAGLHLRRYLAQHAGQAIWSPEMLDPGAFLGRVADWRRGSPAELLVLLHRCHREVAGAKAQPLAAFLEWAPATLRDTSEADSHLVDLDSLYRDLRRYHELGWSLSEEPLSDSQRRTVEQWQDTGLLHRRFQEAMAGRAMGTAGAIARRAAKIAAEPGWQPPWEAVWAAGLNAVEPALMAVLKALQQRGLLHLAWDADRFYLDDPGHEAGRFLRQAIKELGPGLIPPGEAITARERTVESVELPDRMAMCRYAAQWARELPPGERGRAAIVLADEQLLMPLLDALPGDLGPMNVSMGLPLAALPLHGLVARFLRLRAAAAEAVRIGDLVGVLTHPLLHQGAATARLVHALREPGLPNWSRERVLEAMGAAALPAAARAAMEAPADDPHALVQALLDWALQARPGDRLVREQVFQLAVLQHELRRSLAQADGGPMDVREHAAVRDHLLGQARIGLYGEPLHGLQVLGVLETRALSFEHVLILGASEGVLIGQEQPQSWIPFELRRHLRLPLRADSEAIASHHIHRLLQGAARLTLAHAPAADGSGLPARFIEQWEHELGPRARTAIHRRRIAAPSIAPRAIGLQVPKSPATLERLHAMAQKGFSPSALGTWLRCPLDFHMRYILGISDDGSGDGDGLGDDVLGIAVHRAAESIYRPWIGRPLRAEALREAAKGAPGAVQDALREEYPAGMLATGSYLLRSSMAGKALAAWLRDESEREDLGATVPLAVEQRLEAELRPGVRIMGKADRVERRDGVLCVIDLKTGSVQEKELLLASLGRDALAADRGKALQLLMYAAMLLHMHPEADRIRAGIIPLRKRSRADDAWLAIGGERDISRAHLPGITALLLELIDELLDPQRPFAHAPDSDYCLCCVP